MIKNGFISKLDRILKSKLVFRILMMTVIFTFISIFILKKYENKKLKDENLNTFYTKYTEKIKGD